MAEPFKISHFYFHISLGDCVSNKNIWDIRLLIYLVNSCSLTYFGVFVQN